MHAAAGRPIEGSRRSGKRLAATICAAALLANLTPPLASAAMPLGAPTQASLYFASGTARLVGPDALVPVRCGGPPSSLCSGTVTLWAAGHKHKVPFSVLGGSSESLAVPVGGSVASGSARGLAVARTAQSSGGFLRSTEVLHFR